MASMPIPNPDREPSFARGLRLELSLKGQVVQSYSFDKDAVVIGRDPYCDVFVDNPGVSRQHFQIKRGETGEYQVVDMGSSNGTYLNDRPVRTASLRDGDVIQFGKYSLKIGVDELVGADGGGLKPHSTTEGATIMLSPSEVRQMVADARGGAVASRPALVPMPARAPSAPIPASKESQSAPTLWLIVGAVVVAVGAFAWFMLSR
jgi:pSer/pThr/pTyr-binding forkhead associated (FHA) protein